MIKLLGGYRILVLALLFLINAALAGGLYFYLMPEKMTQERELRREKSKISGLQSDLTRLEREINTIDAQQAMFGQIEQKGFLQAQDRRQIQDVLRDIQEESNVIKATASIQSAVIETYPKAEEADRQIINTPISIRVEAITDVDIARYMQMLYYNFPGHVSVTSYKVNRVGEINSAVLRAITNDQLFPLVYADIEIEWRNLVPRSQNMSPQGFGGVR